jgi:hypothetical protein
MLKVLDHDRRVEAMSRRVASRVIVGWLIGALPLVRLPDWRCLLCQLVFSHFCLSDHLQIALLNNDGAVRTRAEWRNTKGCDSDDAVYEQGKQLLAMDQRTKHD